MNDVPKQLDKKTIDNLASAIEVAVSTQNPYTPKVQAIFCSADEHKTLGGQDNRVHRFAIRTRVSEMDCHIASAYVYPTSRIIEVIPYQDNFVGLNDKYCRTATRDLQGKLNRGALLPE